MGIIQTIARLMGADDIAWGSGSYAYNDANGTPHTTPRVNASYIPLANYTGLTVGDVAERWVDARAFTSIANAVAALGASGGTVYCAAGPTWTVGASLTVPADVLLWVDLGAVLNIPNGVTLTVSGGILAGSYQIFNCTGTGNVVFSASAMSEVSPEWWGLNGSTDNVAIQAAIDSVASTKVPLWFIPGRTYVISSDLTVVNPFTFRSDRKNSAIIQAKLGTAVGSILAFPPTTASSGLTTRSKIDGVRFDCNGVASYGINGVTDHTTLSKVMVTGANIAAINLFYGWDNRFEDVETSFNTGDGLVIDQSANGVTITSLKSFNNGGFGIKIVSGSKSIKIMNPTIETCRKGGIWIGYSVSGVDIDTPYFEANAQDGFDFTLPAAINIKADVLLNGSATATTLNTAFPNHVSVRNGTTNAVYTNYFCYGAVEGSLLLEGNSCLNNGSAPALFGSYGSDIINPNYNRIQKTLIRRNTDFTTNISVSPITANLLADINGALYPSNYFDFADTRNYANTALETWTNLDAGPGTSYRSSQSFMGTTVPVWEINYVGTSMLLGFTIDYSSFPQNTGKYYLFGLWTKHAFTNDGNIWVYANGVANSAGYSSNNAWTLNCALFKWPATGTANFGAQKIGATGSVFFTTPVLVELGGGIKELMAAFQERKDFILSAAPTTGTWVVGDRVWFSAPAGGAAPGAVCVTAGAPGVWKDMAVLHA